MQSARVVRNFEYNYLTHAMEAGYKYICRAKNGDIIISKEEPKWTIFGWRYKKKSSERTKLFHKGFVQITKRLMVPLAINTLIIYEDKGDLYVEKEKN